MSDFDLTTDVVIVGGGPAGLACAIRLKHLNAEISVLLLDKAASPGGQLVSGANMDPCALSELWPDWRAHILHTNATSEQFRFLTKDFAIPLPMPEKHDGVILSIGALGAALAQHAQELGVDVLSGFAGQELIEGGIACGDGTRIGARHIVLAEGAHGSLSECAINTHQLRGDRHQTYGLGVKEIWRVRPENHKPGLSCHTIGWPLPAAVHGGGFIYHYGDNLIDLGLITALDYDNPTLSPFGEMQIWKTHPSIARLLEGGERIGYQSRALVEGGWQSLPRLDFPGGVIIGDAAGFLNAARPKGIHMAIRSGMLAAEAYFENIPLTDKVKDSALMRELWQARNVRPGFRAGRLIGLINAGLNLIFGAWRLPLTLPSPSQSDRKHCNPNARPRQYPAPDNRLTFDKLSSLALCAITPPGPNSHLLLKDPGLHEKRSVDPAPAYCPAGVYEFVQGKFVVNHENCVHCKTCAIKDPDGNIVWVPPIGGSGPSYESF